MTYKITLLTFFLFMCSLCSICSADSNIYKEIDDAIITYDNTDSIACVNNVISKIEKGFIDKEQIKELNSKEQTAHLYRIKGQWEIENGSVVLAHKYLYQTIDIYKQHDSDENKEWISKCYYWLFGSYIRSLDTLSMKQTLIDLKAIRVENPELNVVSYNYFMSRAVYQSTIYHMRSQKKDIAKFLLYADSTISYLNKIPNETKIKYDIVSTNIYYNIATAYFKYTEPKDVEKVHHYLKLTEEGINGIKNEDKKEVIKIHVYNEYAWVYLYEKDYPNAIYYIEKVSELLEESKSSYNTLIKEKAGVHKFYIELYESTGEWKKANERRELLIKDLKSLYDIEKTKALGELRVKYEVEKKEADIVLLNQQLKQQTTNIRLGIVVVAIVILLMVLTFVLIVMHKNNVEQKGYEEALAADNKFDCQANVEQKILEKLKNDFPDKAEYFERINTDQLIDLMSNARLPLTAMEKRYIICFMAGMKPSEVAEMFFVESNSVYCVKYRIKKKLANENIPF